MTLESRNVWYRVDDVHYRAVGSGYRILEGLKCDGATIEWQPLERTTCTLEATLVPTAFFSPLRGGLVCSVLLSAFFPHPSASSATPFFDFFEALSPGENYECGVSCFSAYNEMVAIVS